MFENFSKEELESIVKRSESWSEICKCLGIYDKHDKYVPYLRRILDSLKIDYSFLDIPSNKHKNLKNRHNKYTKFKDEEIFIKKSPVGISTIRRRYFSGKFSEYKCAICGMEPFWNGKELILTLDHINGNTNNNELSNLRWICPNCDRQLPTYAGRNKKREKIVLQKKICKKCGKEIEYRNEYCLECFSEMKSESIKLNPENKKPDRNTLKKLIRENSFLKIGKIFDVSDNAVRKWCKKYNLPYKSSEIKKYSDEEWKYI